MFGLRLGEIVDAVAEFLFLLCMLHDLAADDEAQLDAQIEIVRTQGLVPSLRAAVAIGGIALRTCPILRKRRGADGAELEADAMRVNAFISGADRFNV